MSLFQHKVSICNVNIESVGNWDEVITYLTALTIFNTNNTWSALIRYRAAYVETFRVTVRIHSFQINFYYSQTRKQLPTCMLGKVCSVACVVQNNGFAYMCTFVEHNTAFYDPAC
jgi:hypothetical protein